MTDFRPLVVGSLPAQDMPDTIARACEYFVVLGWPGSVPRRSDVMPEDMARFLPYVNMVEVIRDGADIIDFRYRLVGTAQIEKAKATVAGKTVLEAFEEPARSQIFANMLTCVLGPNVVRYKIALPHKHRDHISSERYYFPLRGDGDSIDFILQTHAYE